MRNRSGSDFENLPNSMETGDELVYFLGGGVEVEAGASGGVDVEFVVQGHGAMMPGPHGNAVSI